MVWYGFAVYLDDVVVFGADDAQQAQNLRLVLERFRKYMLTVKPAKCMF